MTTTATSPAHTAGPWRTDSIGIDRIWILDDQSNYIAELVTEDDCGFVCPKDQQAANARLIAAAPELLTALKAIKNDCDKWLNDEMDITADLIAAFFQETSKAIAKAEGIAA